MAADDLPDDLPEDPFVRDDVPDFEEFTGPHAEEIKSALKELPQREARLSALLHQQSFRELRTAVGGEAAGVDARGGIGGEGKAERVEGSPDTAEHDR